MTKFVPKYTFWEGLNIAIHLGMQALDEIRTLARIPGPAGKDGRDGFSFEDLTFEDRDDGVYACFVRGDHRKEHRLASPWDMGVWREGKYLRGHTVSFGGSVFIAKEDTTEKPETGKGWRLYVKRGRDGKDGIIKPEPAKGPLKVG